MYERVFPTPLDTTDQTYPNFRNYTFDDGDFLTAGLLPEGVYDGHWSTDALTNGVWEVPNRSGLYNSDNYYKGLDNIHKLDASPTGVNDNLVNSVSETLRL